MSNGENKLFIIADPSAILSLPHLQDLMKLLEGLEERGEKFKVVLPQLLHSNLEYLERGISEEEIFNLTEVYEEWFPVTSGREAQNNIRDLGNNNEYKSLIRQFRNKYSPENAEKYAYRTDIDSNNLELVNRLFTQEELDQKLQPKRKVSRVLYEMFSVSAKFGGAIVGFFKHLAKGTWELLKKLGKSVIEIRSRFKEELKQRQNIKSALKICVVVASYAAAAAIYSQFGPTIHELIPIGTDSRIPGLQGAIEHGLTFLIING